MWSLAALHVQSPAVTEGPGGRVFRGCVLPPWGSDLGRAGGPAPPEAALTTPPVLLQALAWLPSNLDRALCQPSPEDKVTAVPPRNALLIRSTSGPKVTAQGWIGSATEGKQTGREMLEMAGWVGCPGTRGQVCVLSCPSPAPAAQHVAEKVQAGAL